MIEYRIVCDRGSLFTDGKTKVGNGVDIGVPPIDRDGYDFFAKETFYNIRKAKLHLKYAHKFCHRYVEMGCKRIYQYNFRIQYRDISEWKTLKS